MNRNRENYMLESTFQEHGSRQEQKLLKIIVAGNAGVGKTTLLKRYIEGKFVEGSKMTVGVDHFTKELQFSNLNCKMVCWDLGGQDRFRYIVDFALRGANGALLLFDITNYSSFISLDKWVQLLRSKNQNLPILLVATKVDLQEYSVVKNVLIPKILERNKIRYYLETSSKTGHNVNKVFKAMISNVLE